VILQLQLNEDIGGLNKYDQIFIYHEDKKESKILNIIFYKVNEIFENILIGSSLNPDTQDDNNNIEYSGFEKSQSKTNNDFDEDDEGDYHEYDDEDEEMIDDQDNEKAEAMDDEDDFKPYIFQNTVDKIFKTEKKPKNIGEFNPARFEDAD
jgi:hypothetical protein